MGEKIIEDVINEMVPHLEDKQLEHLRNVLYINFHGKEVCDQCTDLVSRGESGDEAKIRMFIASKKAVNRQDNTLKQYSREILNMLDFLITKELVHNNPVKKVGLLKLGYITKCHTFFETHFGTVLKYKK